MIKLALIIAGCFIFIPQAWAVDPPNKAPSLLDALTQVRMKQEREEVVRVIATPLTVQTENICHPVQQTRQRIRDLGTTGSTTAGNVTVNAGHGTVDVNDNHGTIDNSVAVQIIGSSNERKCY